MKKLVPSRSLLVDIICALLILLFVYAAVNKLIEFDKFQAQIGKSPLILNHSSRISWVIPSLEICISLLLLLPQMRYIALYLSFTLMLLFTLYIAFILKFSPYIPCSCGGILNDLGWNEHLIFNIVFTMISFIGILLFDSKQKPSIDLLMRPVHSNI